jgi:hypothetical protein
MVNGCRALVQAGSVAVECDDERLLGNAVGTEELLGRGRRHRPLRSFLGTRVNLAVARS